MIQEKDTENFDRQAHWEQVYSEKTPTEVSWFQSHPQQSLELVNTAAIDKTARIIDVGGGASTLVDFLLDAGYQNIAVLDIAQAAIEQAKRRLGERASKVVWIKEDVTAFSADEAFDIWHDRAVLHFLTGRDEQKKYVAVLRRTLKPGGQAVIAAFNLEGPDKCSGLGIVRYSAETMSALLGCAFQLIETLTEEHATPRGSSQSFVYCRFRKV